MKKYSKRLFSGLMVTLLLGGNLVSSVGAYAETVLEEPKNGETTSGESPTPPNGEKEAALPSLQDNLPKPADPPVKEPPKVESPTEAPKVEAPKVDSKAEANPKKESAKETESEEEEELPQLSNLEAGDSPKLPDEYGPGADEKVSYQGHVGTSYIWLSSTDSDPTTTLHIGGGDLNEVEDSIDPDKVVDWGLPGELEINKVKIEGPLILPISAGHMFENFSARIFEGAQYLDTSHVLNMDSMFYNSQFEKLDLSSFDTSHVTNMRMMFGDMPNLREVNVSSFDTTNVRTMEGMFFDTISLDELNLSSFNTGNVENFTYMFSNSHLVTLDLSHFNLENKQATSMMLDMRYLNKVILGPNTRLNRDIYWGLETDGEMPYSWKNVDKSDSPLIRPYTLANEYNTNASELSGTYIRIIGNPLIGVHDSTIYIETPNGIKSSNAWEPKDNLDYAYDIHGNSIDIRDIDVDIESGGYNPSVPGKYQIWYTIIGGTTSAFDETTAMATITVKERKEVTLHVNYCDETSGESFTVKEATVKKEYGQPFDILGELENPYLYKVYDIWINKKTGFNKEDYMSQVTYDDKNYRYPTLVYQPSWDDDQNVEVFLGNNINPPKVETNPLTVNLGQSNPGDLKSVIKSVSLDWDTGNVGVQVRQKEAVDQVDSFLTSFVVENTSKERRPAVDLSSGIELGCDTDIFNSVVSTIGTKTLPVKITIPLFRDYLLYDKNDVEQTVDVPVTITENNVLKLGGNWGKIYTKLIVDDSSNSDTFEIKAMSGDTDMSAVINTFYGKMAYTTLELFSSVDTISLNDPPNWQANFIGNTLTGQAISAIGSHTLNKNETNILKVWNPETNIYSGYVLRLTDGTSTAKSVNASLSPTGTSASYYFEVSPDGYKVLTLNQLSPKNGQSIFKNASHDYLNAHVKEFIDSDKYPGLTVSWLEYPDTSTEGNNKPGKLLVTQKSSTGKDLTYEYPVNVNVVPGSVQLVVSDTADFGTIENDGRVKAEFSDFKGYILDTTNAGTNQSVEKHYHITASIANKNEGLAPYLYFIDEASWRKIGDTPDLKALANAGESEEKVLEYFIKYASMYKIIDSSNFEGTYLNDGRAEGLKIELEHFSDVPYHPEDSKFSVEDTVRSLNLLIPPNTPLKVGQNSATISWDIGEVP